MLKIKNNPQCKKCKGVMTAELSMLGGYLLQQQAVNICECCVVETEDGETVPYYEFAKGARVMNIDVTPDGQVNLNRDKFPRKTITQRYREELGKREQEKVINEELFKIFTPEGGWVDASEQLSPADLVTCCNKCGKVRAYRAEENICCGQDLVAAGIGAVGMVLEVDNNIRMARVKANHPQTELNPVGFVMDAETNTIKIGAKEKEWKPCSIPMPIGSPVVACPHCGYFFYIRLSDDSHNLFPIFEFTEICLNCGEKLLAPDLGSIAFVINYRNQKGVKEVQVTYDPEKYPKTIGDNTLHRLEAKEWVQNWKTQRRIRPIKVDKGYMAAKKVKDNAAAVPTKLRKQFEEFDRTHVTVADLTIGGLENLYESDYPQVASLFAAIRGLWSSSSSRIGTLYLTRDEDETLVLSFPFRLKANDKEFDSLKELIENVKLEKQ